MGLKDRIEKLENRPEVKRCPECRLPPGGPGYIVYEDGKESREQEWCSVCGEPMYLVIRVAYDDEDGAAASSASGDMTWP